MSTTTLPRIARQNPLPDSDRNPLLQTLDASTGVVKYQVITRGEGEEIVVGRLKIPTPGEGHAFVLRRFDTGAVSVSTMIRAAFPTLNDDLEKKETGWVRTAFDCAGANGAGARRLAGVWAPLPVALHLAETYDLAEIITPLATAVPDPRNVPRRSTRSSAAAAENSNLQPTPSPGKAKTPPPKRRRAESPKSPTTDNASLPALSASTGLPTTRRRSVGPARASASPGRVTRASLSPSRLVPLRRSLRSPNPSTPTVPEVDDADEPTIGGVDPVDDIEESKAIVEAVKKAAAESSVPVVIDSVTVKRSRDDDTTLTLNLHREDPQELAVARPIASNRRVVMTPTRKAAAWGALAFSIGLGAVTFLPSFL